MRGLAAVGCGRVVAVAALGGGPLQPDVHTPGLLAELLELVGQAGDSGRVTWFGRA